MRRHPILRPPIVLMLMLLALLAMVLASAGCSGGESTGEPQAETETAPASQVRVSIAGMFTPRETYSIYAELIDYLAKKTGHPTVLLQTGSYMSVNDSLAREETDIALVCSGGYVEAYHHLGLPPLVAPVVNGQPYYYSYILARKDSGITSFEELRGHRFAFGDPLSLTGTLYPTARVAGLGYQPDSFFSDYIYTYNHDNSIKAIQEGVVEGTAVDSLIFEYLKQHNPESIENLVIIEQSPPYGAPPIVARRNLPQEIRDEIVRTLTEMDDDAEGREILAQLGIEGFTRVDASLYRSVEELEANMALRP